MNIISPSEIQNELTRIWDTLDGTQKMRASLFNLIFYTRKTSRDTYLHTIAQKVIEQFPSRVIFISVDNDTNEDILNASVSIMYAGKGESAVACDLIHLDVSKSKLGRIPFVILPHILPDLPVYLVWEEDPSLNNPIFADLLPLASRLIFDSESAAELPRFASSILNIYKSTHTDITDLNWARMESWRTLFTANFYSLERLAILKKVNQITITFNAHETESFCHTSVQAIYLQSWLACQLGWELKETKKVGNEIHFIYQDLSIILKPEKQPNLAPCIITGVDLVTAQNEHFCFERHKETPNRIVINIETPHKCEIPFHHIFAKAESGQSLVKEICHRGTSSHFLKVLEQLKKLEMCSIC